MTDSAAFLEPLARRRFIHIPGPNPIVCHGGAGEWDERCIEAGDIFKDYHVGRETYYLYYHGVPADEARFPRRGYRIGVATAIEPTGPFRKAEQNPLLDLGPEGAWDDRHVACPCILKLATDRYVMWYSGSGVAEAQRGWHVGLAMASHPLGPWSKHPGNPILRNFGYIGGVVFAQGRYCMLNEHPIGSTAPDYGPLCVATAPDPSGPWTPYAGNPVLAPEGRGAWDDGGFSEAKVVYREGVYHVFYGAAKEHRQRMRTLESIGYAASRDGLQYIKHLDNPVAAREHQPGAASFSEVKCLFEPPLVYLYHTLRYLGSDDAHIEDLGVQVLAMERPFALSMPLLHVTELAPRGSTRLEDCPTLCLSAVERLALTVECTYAPNATVGLRLHVRTSPDGYAYDSVDHATLDVLLAAGQRVRQTLAAPAGARFAQVLVVNDDELGTCSDLSLVATLMG